MLQSVKLNKIKLLAFIFVFIFSAAFVSGCNNDADNAEQAAENPEDNENADTPQNIDAQPDMIPTGNALPQNASDVPVPDEPNQVPIAEKSPVAITRIEPENIQIPDEPVVTGEGAVPDDNDKSVDSDGDGIPNEHEHEPAPNLFPVDRCQVEINGTYKKDLATEIISQINAQRQSYDIAPVTRNTSLLACADTRAKEQTYFIGHFRPNGAPWNSVAPGYVQGECIAVDYRDAEKLVTAWYSVNDTREQLMNPEYTQVGVSVYEVEELFYEPEIVSTEENGSSSSNSGSSSSTESNSSSSSSERKEDTPSSSTVYKPVYYNTYYIAAEFGY